MLGQAGVVAPILIHKAPGVLSEKERALKIKGTVVLSVRVSKEAQSTTCSSSVPSTPI